MPEDLLEGHRQACRLRTDVGTAGGQGGLDAFRLK